MGWRSRVRLTEALHFSLLQSAQDGSFPGGMKTDSEVGRLPPSRTGVKNICSYTTIPPLRPRGVDRKKLPLSHTTLPHITQILKSPPCLPQYTAHVLIKPQLKYNRSHIIKNVVVKVV
jgi:hypothetical protein